MKQLLAALPDVLVMIALGLLLIYGESLIAVFLAVHLMLPVTTI